MKRREFLASSLSSSLATSLAGSAPMAALAEAAERADEKPQYYELRLYHQRRGPKQKVMDDYYRDVSIPAMKRLGIGPIGVFNVVIGPDSPTLYVLITHPGIETFATAQQRLKEDKEYQAAAESFMNVPATDPSYIRMESSLMVAFSGMPKLEIPAQTADKRPRLFELRTYESHNKRAGQKKIEMFNTGEIAIFRKNGLQPVFFGQTLIGSRMPNLTYMLVFDDMAARDRSWSAFGGDPDWKKLSATPGYTDAEVVSNISNVLLRPTPYSEI